MKKEAYVDLCYDDGSRHSYVHLGNRGNHDRGP